MPGIYGDGEDIFYKYNYNIYNNKGINNIAIKDKTFIWIKFSLFILINIYLILD